MGQRVSREGGDADGTLVRSLVINQASLGVTDDKGEAGDADVPGDGRAGLRAAQHNNGSGKQKKDNPYPKRQTLFKEELDLEVVTNGKESGGRADKKSKSKRPKSNVRCRTPSRRRSARVAPSLPPPTDVEETDAGLPDVEANAEPTTKSFFELSKSSELYLEVDDDTHEASMESETESLNMRPTSDSESEAAAPGAGGGGRCDGGGCGGNGANGGGSGSGGGGESSGVGGGIDGSDGGSGGGGGSRGRAGASGRDCVRHQQGPASALVTEDAAEVVARQGGIRLVVAMATGSASGDDEHESDDEEEEEDNADGDSIALGPTEAPPGGDYMTSQALYNAMNDGQLSPYLFDPSYLLMVDAREACLYRASHIVTAHHIADLAHPEHLDYPLTAFTWVVLYDAAGSAHSVADDSPLGQLHARLAGLPGVQPMLLWGGYDAFLKDYAFLCTDQLAYDGRRRWELLVQYPSEIVPRVLYLGRGEQATDNAIVTNLRLTHIVNISTEHPNAFPGRVRYLRIQVPDEPTSDLHGAAAEIVDFIDGAIRGGGRVLVHCNLGRSRGATAVIAFLMATRRWTLNAAFRYVKERRPIIDPNRGFLQQLAMFELETLGENTSDPDALWMG